MLDVSVTEVFPVPDLIQGATYFLLLITCLQTPGDKVEHFIVLSHSEWGD